MERVAFVVLLSACLGGCMVDLTFPDGAQIRCADDDDCPDGTRCSAQGLCISVDANQPPQLVVGSPNPSQGGRWLSTVQVSFSVTDPNGAPVGRDPARVEFRWGIADASSGEVDAWNPATPHSTSDPLDDIGGNNHARDVSFVWDAVSDLAGTVGTYEADLDGDESGDRPAAVYVERLRLRAIATDAGGATSEPVQTTDFSLGDGLPEVVLGAFEPPLSGPVPIAVTLTDDAFDPVTVELQFRVDSASAWQTPEITFGNLEALPSSDTGLEHVVLWNSASQTGGIGAQSSSTVQLRVRAFDEPLEGVTNYAAWCDPVTLPEVQNQTAPYVAELVVPRAARAGGASPIVIDYRVIDAESDRFDARFEYSVDGGVTYSACRELARFPSQGRTDLVAAPDNAARSGGVWHAFVWNPTGVVFSPVETTRVRVTVADRPGQVTSAETGLGYAVGPTAVSASYAAFAASESIVTGYFSGSVAPGDFDSDGVTDFVVGLDYDPYSAGDPRLTILTGQGATEPGNGSFFASDGPLTSWGVADVQVVDLDGNDSDDIVIVEIFRDYDSPNDGDAKLTAFLGDGTGSFGAARSTAVIPWGRSVRLGHLNADSSLDAVVNAAGTVYVFLGNGDGTFGTPDVYSTGPASYLGSSDPQVIADLDGDDDKDVAAVRYGGDEIAVLLNDGAASFTLEASFLVGQRPAGLVAVDFNRDGLMDLAASNRDDATVSALMGTGLAGHDMFDGPAAYSAGLEPRGMGVIDVNRDGYRDLVVANQGSNNVALLVGLGGSSVDTLFGAPSFYDTGDAPISVAVAEVDGDGLRDLMVGATNGYNDSVYLLRSQIEAPLASFAAPVPGATTLSPARVVAADFHDDGALDLATVGGPLGVHDGVRVGWGARGVVGAARTIDVDGTPGPYAAGALDTADLNGDGVTDIAAYRAGAAGVQVYLGSGTDGIADGGFTAGPLLTWSTCGAAWQVFIEDFDRDGQGDIVVLVYGCGQPGQSMVRVFLANGVDVDGEPTYDNPLEVDVVIYNLAMTVADFNGDGWLDLAAATHSQISGVYDFGVRVSLNDLSNSGTFLDPVWLSTTQEFERNNALCAGDFDDDGRTDVAVAGRGHVLIAYGNGDGSLVQGPTYNPSTMVGDDELTDIVCIDANRDGILDLLVAHPSRSQVVYYQGNGAPGAGDGTFVEAASIPTGIGVSGLSTADINDDGLVDLLTSVPSVIMAQLEDRTSGWGRRLVDFGQFPPTSAEPQAYLVGRELPQVTTTLLGDASDDGQIAQYPLAAEGWLDHLPASLAEHGLTAPPDLLPVTLAWEVPDPSRFDVVAEETLGMTPIGDGLRLCTASAPFDLDATTPTGVIVELPILSGRTTAQLGGDIRVFHRRERLVRASEIPSDPENAHPQASACLPEISDAVGEGRTVVHWERAWVEIPVDDDLDFRTGSSTGPRFVVSSDPAARHEVWVLTDTFGVFQAVVSGP